MTESSKSGERQEFAPGGEERGEGDELRELILTSPINEWVVFFAYPRRFLKLAIEVLTPIAMLGAVGVIVAGVIPVWAGAALFMPLFLLVFLDEEMGSFRPHTVSGALGLAGFFVAGTVAFYLFYRWVATSWPLFLQIPLVGYSALVIPPCAWILSRPRSRAWAVRLWRTVGPLGPACVLVTVLVLLTSLFGAITFIFERQDLIELSKGGESPSFEDIAAFYTWEFLKAVPLLDVNATLRWLPPLTYKDSTTGVFVLLYKLTVIVPVIGTFLLYWRFESPAPTQSDEGERDRS
jgi:hypothetical protein